MIILEISGLVFLAILILYKLSSPIADKIKYYLRLPFKSISFFDKLHNKITTTELTSVMSIFIMSGKYIKKFAVIINRFENEYIHHFLQNIEDFISLLGLVSKKIHDANIRICTAYILVFIVLFYFIFRVM